MKILILIMSHETEDDNFINYKKIWDEQISKLDYTKFDFEFKFLYSDNTILENYIIKNNNIITKCPENYWYSLALKVMSGFDYFVKNNFDLVFKTNLSTIINFDKFYEYSKQLPKSKKFIYDGFVGSYQDYSFCSGAGMLLNKNSANLVLDNKTKLNESWTDDIFIGFILNKLNGIPTNEGGMNRFDIITENPQFSKEDIVNNTHTRIKIRKSNLDILYSNLVYSYLK
jgi:hypothetical protein